MTDQKSSIEEKVYTLIKLDKSKRRWRLLAILLLIVGLFMNMPTSSDDDKEKIEKDFIAEIKIKGMILSDDYRSKVLDEIKNKKEIKAVIVTIDSPGGAMVPGLEILDELKLIAKVKPLVVQMKSVAASAGYLISLSGDYVVANRATLTGSIGVLMPLVDATDFSKKLGVKSSEITSGDLKSITSPFNKRSQKAQKYLQNTVNDLQKVFLAEVVLKRNLTKKQINTVKDGRFVIGQEALNLNLIDAIGNKNTLVTYLHNMKDIDKTLKIKEVSLKEPKKLNWQEILTDEITSKISLEVNSLFNSNIAMPVLN